MLKTFKPTIILSFALLIIFGLYLYDGISGLRQIAGRRQNIQPIVLGESAVSGEIPNQEVNQADIKVDNQPVVKEKSGQTVVYYGTPRFVSTSGCSSFYYYNVEKNELEKPGNPYHWFWACVKDENMETIMEYYNLFHDKHVFKITGTANKDDSSYYGNGKSVKDITIESVEIIN